MKVINRIKKNEDFSVTINKGRSSRLSSFIIYNKENELGYSRVGISASKKLGNAVTRNRIKRLVRAMCDALIDYNNLSLDFVIIVRTTFLNNSFDVNKSQLSDYLKGL